MKAITVEPGKPGTARLEDIPEPDLREAAQAPGRADRTWLSRLITRREKPENFQQALTRTPDDIKVVIQFSEV